MSIIPDIEREYDPAVPVDALHEHARNPRDGDVGAISQSIDAHGFYSVVIAQRGTGVIIAGAHRWKAAKAKGMTTVPVLWLTVDDRTADRIRIADNRMSDLATDDKAELASWLEQMQNDGGLAGLGFDASDLDTMLSELAVDALADDAATDADPDAVTFRLGEYTGNVSLDVYQSFQAAFDKRRKESANVQLDDVLRSWLKLPSNG